VSWGRRRLTSLARCSSACMTCFWKRSPPSHTKRAATGSGRCVKICGCNVCVFVCVVCVMCRCLLYEQCSSKLTYWVSTLTLEVSSNGKWLVLEKMNVECRDVCVCPLSLEYINRDSTTFRNTLNMQACVRTHAHTHTHTQTHTHSRTHKHTHKHTHKYTHAHTQPRLDPTRVPNPSYFWELLELCQLDADNGHAGEKQIHVSGCVMPNNISCEVNAGAE